MRLLHCAHHVPSRRAPGDHSRMVGAPSTASSTSSPPRAPGKRGECVPRAACALLQQYDGRRILGEWQEGTGRIVEDEPRRSKALAELQRKYGWQLSLATLISRLRGSYQDRVVLELTSAARSAVELKTN
jgi:hypothetical protein